MAVATQKKIIPLSTFLEFNTREIQQDRFKMLFTSVLELCDLFVKKCMFDERRHILAYRATLRKIYGRSDVCEQVKRKEGLSRVLHD